MEVELSKICSNVSTEDNFVGVRYSIDGIRIIFPLGYRIPNSDQELLESIKQLFKTIQLVHEKKIDYEDSGIHKNDANGLPMDSFLWIMNDYLNNGIICDNEKVYRQDHKGKINWKRTFKTKSFVHNNSCIYLNPIVEKNSNMKNILSEIHAYTIDCSSKILEFMYHQTTKLSEVGNPNLKYYIHIIQKEMLLTFDDRKKLLLYHMKRIIEGEIASQGKKDVRDYGIRHYECVWEYMVNQVYGTENIKKYYPDSTYFINDINPFLASKLRPDTILKDNENNLYIIDSKYYKAGIVASSRSDLKNLLPNTSSIQKQITYGDFILKHFKKKDAIKDIYNAFVLPYNKKNNHLEVDSTIAYLGYAICNWKMDRKDVSYLKIAILFMDMKDLMERYFSENRNQEMLIDSIKKIDDENIEL